MRLVFMGTPETAVPTLRRCLADGHEVVAVWTQPDRPAGRGNKLSEPPVKDFALAHGLTVHQPAKIKTDEARALFVSHEADAAVVVAYGRILPASFLNAPRRGCINVHFSLLPKYRGAAPVNWAIVRGETETGVTTMRIDEGLDTGALYLQRATPIGDAETAPQVLARLAALGAELLGETLARLDELEPRPQREEEATHAPILRREDGLIDWRARAPEIDRRVRGFQPWPNAYTHFRGQRLVIHQSLPRNAPEEVSAPEEVDAPEEINAHNESMDGAQGSRLARAAEIVEAHGDQLEIACGERTRLRLSEVQLEGKRRMSARDFINGMRVRAGERLGEEGAGEEGRGDGEVGR
ncbi:MAG TPA: methionyl-tRNA formyltransferase [Pyrinomonadaceae bacterium]|nr:methionyl-tRNA formyltransferase [Pyrinomonadaceae bacterium]